MTRWTRTLKYYRRLAARLRPRRLTDEGRALAGANWRLALWAAGRAARLVPGLHEDDALSIGHDALVAGVEAWLRKGRRKGHTLGTYVGWQARSLATAERDRRAARAAVPLPESLPAPGPRAGGAHAEAVVRSACARLRPEESAAVLLIVRGVTRSDVPRRLGLPHRGSTARYWVRNVLARFRAAAAPLVALTGGVA